MTRTPRKPGYYALIAPRRLGIDGRIVRVFGPDDDLMVWIPRRVATGDRRDTGMSLVGVEYECLGGVGFAPITIPDTMPDDVP